MIRPTALSRSGSAFDEPEEILGSQVGLRLARTVQDGLCDALLSMTNRIAGNFAAIGAVLVEDLNASRAVALLISLPPWLVG